MITFDEARRIVAESPMIRAEFGTDSTTAEYGWQNDGEFLIAVVRPAGPMFDGPDILVDKHSGEIRKVYGMMGKDPVPGLVPIGDVPN